MLKSLPNVLTVFRVVAILPIAVLLMAGGQEARWIALAIYAVACLTDYVDGWLARKIGATSAFGRMLDPIADKVLVGSLIVMLAATNDAPVIPAIIIIFRELLISGVREQLATREVVIHVTTLAKWKTFVQMIAVGFVLPGHAGLAFGDNDSMLHVGHGLFWIAALLTAVTGIDYLRQAFRQLRAPSA